MLNIWVQGNYFFLEDTVTGKVHESHAKDVKITKDTNVETSFYLRNICGWEKDNIPIPFAEIKKEGGASWVDQTEFETFYRTETGKSNGGGDGAGVASVTGYNVNNADPLNPVMIDQYEERFDLLTLTTNNAWHTITVPGSPANKVLNICIKVQMDNQDAGVRQVGSTIDRRSNIGENGFGVSSISSIVKTNASGEIQVYSGRRQDATFMVMAYQN